MVFCFLFTWLFLGFCGWRLWTSVAKGMQYAKRLHQIPCSQCAYFTGSYHLKCAIHPCHACTEEAIDCLDFRTQSYAYRVPQSSS